MQQPFKKRKKIMKTKRFINLLTAAVLLFQTCAYAVESVDYSAKLAELEGLLKECETMGYATDYERVNYSVIKRFEGLLNEDIENSHPAVETNIAYMDELYLETKESLEAYIAGEKTPKTVTRPNALETEKSGAVIYSDEQPVFSIGYGHFGMVREDVENFADYGMTNIQIEIGPTKLVPDFYGWSENIMGTPDATIARELVTGDYAIHITNNSAYENNTYIRYYKKIPCTPDTKYYFGCTAKGDGLESVWISVNDFADRNFLSSSPYWKQQGFYFTTGEAQTTLTLSFCSQDIADCYLDDFFVYEADASGVAVGENLVKNPSLEDDDCYSNSTAYVTDTLKLAEQNNVGVSLLISPHYFPTDLDADIYGEGGFLKYNVNAPEAKEVLKNYLDILLPRLLGYKSLDSICISNEPTFSTITYYDFYNPLFKEYLKSVHKDIAVLNAKYGTDYSDFSQVNMPTDLNNYDAICYDWIEFNDKTFTDWHKWLADIVKTHLPEIPVHSKMMGYFAPGEEDTDRNRLMRGTDLEYFDEFSDYAGNDTWDFKNNINLYYNTMFLYDYQNTVTKKPVYNSEDHIIEDREKDFSENQRKHLRNNLWMGAAHGRSMSTVWVWDKSTDTSSSLYNSIAYRPDCAAEAGRTSLDLMRYSYEMAKLQQEKPQVAIFYSKPSRLYNENHSQKLLWSYMSLINMGEKVGVVSDNSIDLLSDYDVLVIPDATNCKENTLEKVEEFINNGGKVIYTGDVFSADEYNNELDNSAIISGGKSYSSDTADDTDDNLYPLVKETGVAELKLVDSETGARADGVDWQYSIDGRNILITLTNLEYDTTKNLNIYKDGEMLTGLKECFSGETGIETISLEGYTPQLLKLKLPKTLTQEIENITVDKENGLIKWDYRTDDYFGAKVYSVSDTGAKALSGVVTGNQYAYSNAGTYVVTALLNNMFETDGRIVTIRDEKPFGLTCEKYTLSDRGVTLEIGIENTLTSVNTGVVCIKAYDEAENVVGYAYNKMTLLPSKSDSFKLMLKTAAKPNRVEIQTVDSVVSKNAYSETITLNIQ